MSELVASLMVGQGSRAVVAQVNQQTAVALVNDGGGVNLRINDEQVTVEEGADLQALIQSAIGLTLNNE